MAAGVTVVNKTINRVAELARGSQLLMVGPNDAHAAGGLRWPQGALGAQWSSIRRGLQGDNAGLRGCRAQRP